MKLRTIRLYGELGIRFGRVHKLAVETPKEAVRALCVLIEGFEQFMASSKQLGLTFAVFTGKKNVHEDELVLPGDGDIRIAPVVIGSKKQGLFQTILGVVLVVVGAVLNAYTYGAGVPLMQAGAGLAFGGVALMLSGQMGGLGRKEDPNNMPSYAFGGAVNTVAQGYPVPVLYGERMIGGAYYSAGIYAEDQNIEHK